MCHLGQVDDSGGLLPFHCEGLQDPSTRQYLPSDHLSAGSRHEYVIHRLSCHDRQVPLGTKKDIKQAVAQSVLQMATLGPPAPTPLPAGPPTPRGPDAHKDCFSQRSSPNFPTISLPPARQAPLWLPRRHNRNPVAASVHTGQYCTPNTLEGQDGESQMWIDLVLNPS